jgi:hypothetical protein
MSKGEETKVSHHARKKGDWRKERGKRKFAGTRRKRSKIRYENGK